ncbi:phosphate ABC transporter permease PstA [Paenibacillus sp. GCM10027626]|uniref:phosphate ABC transporter permease PstA n=1 Tax=Paenibacillus sp. GCM10027626 TaxID=3273411 RepID=UPI00362766F6
MSNKANQTVNMFAANRSLNRLNDRLFTGVVWGIGICAILLICYLLFIILEKGLPKLDFGFLYGLPSEIEEGGGIGPTLFNSFYMLILSLIISIPLGMAAGIYLAEFAPDNKLIAFIRICVEALASVPSIIFGLFGIAIFVEAFEIGLTILGGAVSLAFLNLPVLTRVTEEAIRAVPQEMKHASFALGGTHLQTIRRVLIPVASSSIITGICLVAGRAFGESAVIILTAGVSTSGEMWDFDLFSPGATLAVHLWYVQSEAIVPDATEIAEKAAAVLVFVVLLINVCFRLPLWLSRRKTKQ